VIDEKAWATAKDAWPIGTTVVSVVVERKVPFGLFVKLPGLDGVTGVIEIVDYRPGGIDIAGTEALPGPGALIDDAVVIEHTEHNREIKLRVGPSWWAASDT